MPTSNVDAIADKLVREMWARPSGKLPETVYHYTNAPGLVGILTSRNVWATDCRCLNDATESELGIIRARELIRGRSFSAKHDSIRRFYRDLRDYLALPNPNRNFVFSLSSRQDDLSQWRAYANDGRGFTVGFSTQMLLKHASDDAGKFGFSKVSYNAAKRETQLREIINQFESEVAASSSKGHELLEYADSAAAAADWVITAYSVLTKHSSFVSEREWRINTYEDDDCEVRVRAQGDRLVPYIELALCTEDENCLPITTIGIGPGFKDKAARYAVEKLCEQTGFEAEIYYADSPFRRL